MIKRLLQKNIAEKLRSGKVIILIGPRQVGKTTLVNTITSKKEDVLFLDGDDPTVRSMLTNPNTEELRGIIGSSKYTFIDEAQRIENIGITLKIIHDQIRSTQLIVSGSSAFELLNKTHEPLTGRKWNFNLYPISWTELEQHLGYLKASQQLALRLVYGMYPDVINSIGDEEEVLSLLTESYLYKDVLSLTDIKKPEALAKLTRALAYQVGSEVSYAELSNLIDLDAKTVAKYIDLLEQSFVVFRLPSFSRNLRNEIKRNTKIYFYDNGVRNAVIDAFKPLDLRKDVGALWENFLVSERLKKNRYEKRRVSSYFWRTKQKQGIDYIEEHQGDLSAYEFKWSSSKNAKFSATFTNNYDATLSLVNSANFRAFIM